MRKLLTIFLIPLFCLSQAGLTGSYILRQWQIRNMVRQEIYAGIAEKFLDQIEENDRMIWQEEGAEFQMCDEMYDVIKTKIIDGKRVYYCLQDKEEEDLLAQFAKAVSSACQNEKGKTSTNSLKFQVIDQYLFTQLDLSFIFCLIKRESFDPKILLMQLVGDIIIPPPRSRF